MFEITSHDISLLSDEDLRSLIGRLCESEVRSRGISTSFVTWGGDQNASDGGIDVRVSLPNETEIEGFVPRPATGFQVKKSEIGPVDILEEMRPDGSPRPAIRDLADRSGAYVIVSSGTSTSDSSLQRRRSAMKKAVEDIPNAGALSLDFYDSGRLASWVRDHPGLVAWVKERIGQSIHGWQSFGSWTSAPEGVGGEYLLDEALRIRADAEIGETTADGLRPLEGIERMRNLICQPGKVVRLVGLSGVGKTRLAQALFDDRIGSQSLDPSLAAYTNVADGPDPQPTFLCSDLIASRRRAILVVDNCPPELHHRLSESCRAPGSTVSVISVEYDIREDQPEGTDVFVLEPSSTDLISKLIKRRFPHLSEVNVKTIAEFSGGNARIAIALAETVERDDTLGGMSDEELFKRLFQQRHESSDSLLLAAQAMSLAYSYQGEDISTGNDAELFRFGILFGKNAPDMYQSTAELLRRKLVQRRGPWRAVLPQAIANRLAAIALQNIPTAMIEAQLINTAPQRLVRSFSRRLGYLDSSQEAGTIVRGWLNIGGRLANLAELDDLGRAVLYNVAPVAPESVLVALERGLLESRSDEAVLRFKPYVSLLRSLAYDATLFERCARLILRIAETQDVDKDSNDASKAFASLFPIYLSGSHATIDQRLLIIKLLVQSENSKQVTLGLMALGTVMQASHFGPAYNFEFGARSRDYGFWPRNRDDIEYWYKQSLSLVEMLACLDEPLGSRIRTVLADRFRGLWTYAAVHDDLERVCRTISVAGFWVEGWVAVRQTFYYDSKGFSPEVSARLASLETVLGPKDLAQKVRSIVLSEGVTYVGVDATYDGTNDIEKTMMQVESMARELGKAVAADPTTFAELLPELIAGKSQQIWNFGGGLAEGQEAPKAKWDRMVSHLAAVPAEKQNPQIFRGFLNALRSKNPQAMDALLDDALENERLAIWFPVLQTAAGIDQAGVNRLVRSLELGKAWIGLYRYLVMGGVMHQIPGPDFNRLLLRIAEFPEGVNIAIEILFMRLSFEDGRRHSSDPELVDVGCELMRRLRFADRKDVSFEHRLRTVGRNCLVGEKGAATIREICSKLKEAIRKSETSAYYQQELLQVIFTAQPLVALDALCGGTQEDLKFGIRILDEAGQLRANTFDSIPAGDLLAWCDQQPDTRYAAVATGITAFESSVQTGQIQWTSTALKLLNKAPGRVEVLKKFTRQFSPFSWSGPRASIVEANSRLLDELSEHTDPEVREFVATEKIRFAETVEAERNFERRINVERDERFE